MIFLDEHLQRAWAGRDPFEEVARLDGKVYRDLDGRKTLNFILDGKSYFLKWHRGVGWKEILKNLASLRLPVVSAWNEWRAIELLTRLGVDTMTVAAYGRRGLNPARRESFIITRELMDTISLEDFCLDWRRSRPDPVLKRRLIDRVADISRALHDAGICHRDYYLCHFLLENSTANESTPRLYLIDLHRALVKTSLQHRWRVKDIAGLFFSSMDIGLTQRDQYRFMRRYRHTSLRETLKQDAQFWRDVESTARTLYSRLGNPRLDAQ